MELIKDYSELISIIHYVSVDGCIIWPVTMQGKTVEEVESRRLI